MLVITMMDVILHHSTQKLLYRRLPVIYAVKGNRYVLVKRGQEEAHYHRYVDSTDL